MFYVLRRYGVSLPAAAVGRAVYGFSPALTHSAIGHYQLQFAVLPPLIVDAVLRLCLRSSRPVRGGIWLGVLVVAQIFIGEEMLFEACLTAVLLVAVLAASRPRAVASAVRPAALGLATGVGVTLLLAGWALWAQFFGPLTQHGTAFYVDFYKNPLAGFVTPDSAQLLHTGASAAAAARYAGLPAEYLGYLGVPLIVVLLFVAIAFWRRLPVRASAVATAVLLLLSIGGHPLLSVIGQPARPAPGRHPAAVGLARAPAGGQRGPRGPAVDRRRRDRRGHARVRHRLRADAAAGQGLQPGPGRDARGRRHRRRRAAAGAAAAGGGGRPCPCPDGWSTTLGALRLPAGARVLVVPVPTATLDDALRWQADSGQRISLIGGYFEGPDGTGQAYIDGGGFPALTWYLDYLWLGKAWTARRRRGPRRGR